MGDSYNFEDGYFPVRSEEKKAIERTKRELLLKKIVPEAKAEVDKMKEQVQRAKRAKMEFLPISPTLPAAEFLEKDRQRLPAILLKTSDDPELPRPKNDSPTVESPVRRTFHDPTHLRQDRPDFDRALQNGAVKTESLDSVMHEKEWWNDPFNEENYDLFNRLTIKNNLLADFVDPKTASTRPQNFKK
jgi:hypothetical protein